jgi:hypothetical protein
MGIPERHHGFVTDTRVANCRVPKSSSLVATGCRYRVSVALLSSGLVCKSAPLVLFVQVLKENPREIWRGDGKS